MTWSPGDVDVEIQSLLVQVYPVLLSTLLSIGRDQLSVFDANFALVISSSPLTIYLVTASICDLFGIRTGLYKRIKSYRLITRTLGVLVLLLWTGLSMSLSLSTRAFKDSPSEASTFAGWLQNTALSLLSSPTFSGILAFLPLGLVPALIILWIVCILRRLSRRRADIELYPKGASWLSVQLKWMWCVPVNIGPQLAKSNATKAHYGQQPSVVVLLRACVH